MKGEVTFPTYVINGFLTMTKTIEVINTDIETRRTINTGDIFHFYQKHIRKNQIYVLCLSLFKLLYRCLIIFSFDLICNNCTLCIDFNVISWPTNYSECQAYISDHYEEFLVDWNIWKHSAYTTVVMLLSFPHNNIFMLKRLNILVHIAK